MTEKETMQVVVAVVLCTLGMVLHFLKKASDLEATGTILTPRGFVSQAPYRTALAVLSTYLLLVVYYYMSMLNPLVGLLNGVACGSAYDSLRARAIKKMRGDEEDGPVPKS